MDDEHDKPKRCVTRQDPSARAAPSFGSVTIKSRVYYSSYHLWAAKHLCELAKAAEEAVGDRPRFDIEHRAYVTNSIFSAVAFLEAAINELYQDAADDHESYIYALDPDSKRLMSDFWQFTEGQNRTFLGMIQKYQLALTFLRKPLFEKGQSPYQDASLVVKVRNELVHYRPELLGGEAEHKLARQLRDKFRINKLMAESGNPWFPDKCLGYGCAQWAVESITTFADEFFARISVTPHYQRADLLRTE